MSDEIFAIIQALGQIAVLLDQPPYCCVFRSLATKTLSFITQAYC